MARDEEPCCPLLIPPVPQPCGIGSLRNNHGIHLCHFLFCRMSLCTCHATPRGRPLRLHTLQTFKGLRMKFTVEGALLHSNVLTPNAEPSTRCRRAVTLGWLPAARSVGVWASTSRRSPLRLVLRTQPWSSGGGKMRPAVGRSGQLPCGINLTHLKPNRPEQGMDSVPDNLDPNTKQ